MGFLSFPSRRRSQPLQEGEDYLLITWDSCRYDACLAAHTPNLDRFGAPERGWAMATYTLPAHVAMFQGFLPHVFEPLPLYNRYRQQLWRISHRSIHNEPLVTFPEGTRNVMWGFRKRGYFTVGVGAMPFFKNVEALRDGFEHFRYTRTAAREQNEIVCDQIEQQSQSRPYFAFMNMGETHSPFRHAEMERDPELERRFTMRRSWNERGLLEEGWEFDHAGFGRQIACVEYLDQRLGELLAFIERRGRPTTVVVCADHGECFGENGVHGHALYHEKVMEVPMLIFRVNAPPHPVPPDGRALDC